jgi:nitrogen fixation protein FixH
MNETSPVPSSAETPTPPSRFANRWAFFPIGLLGILVTIQVVLFSISRTDPSFAVESEYYQKAVSWDQEAKQRTLNAELGWHVTPQLFADAQGARLGIQLTDNTSQVISGAAVTVVAFPNARASQIQQLALRETEPGLYVAPIRLLHRGEWEIRLTVMRDGKTYTHISRVSPVPAS